MNEFVKWWNENGGEFNYYTQQSAWIAALTWVLYELVGEQNHIRGVIRQELKALENE